MKSMRLSREWISFAILFVLQIVLCYLNKGQMNNELLVKVIIEHTILVYLIIFMVYALFEELRINNFYRDIVVCSLGTIVCLALCVNKNRLLLSGLELDSLKLQLIFLMNFFEGCFLLRAIRYVNKPTSFKTIVIYNIVMIGLGLISIYGFGVRIHFLLLAFQVNNFYTYLFIITFSIYIVIFIMSSSVKNQFSEQAYINFHKYLFCRILIQAMLILVTLKMDYLSIGIVSALRLIATYYLFRVFLGDLIHMSASLYGDKKEKENKELTCMIKELSDTKQELQSSLKKYTELVTFLPEGVINVQNNVIHFANDKIAHLFNLKSPSSLEGKNIFNIIHPIDHRHFIEQLDKDIDNEIALIHFTLLGHHFAGEVRFINIDKEDKKRYTMIIRDLTEQMKLIKMEHILLEKTQEEKIKNEVLANISHEFKTPVNVIYAAAQLQEQNILSKDWDGVRKYTPVMRQNCNRLIRLINNFIDITRLNHGELHIKKVCVNIVPMIEDVTLSIVSFAENKNISVLFDTEDEEIYCDIDIDLVERVMLNLLSNAIKYNKVDGSIEVFISQTKEQVEISIKDTGVGIEKEHMKILFNRFERGDKTLTRDNEGSGLGLNIAKNMIECLDGEIEVRSALGAGTTMIVYLPKSEMGVNFDYGINEYCYDASRLKKSVEMELSDIYE